MKEVLSRRLLRDKSGDERFAAPPDLIVIDGGKGQLSSAFEAMTALGLDYEMISLAKREEEVFLPGESDPRVLPKSGNALKLLQRIRDEAHRFAIAYHRKLRAKRFERSLGRGK
jgi:excinuclease ABC subunit C